MRLVVQQRQVEAAVEGSRRSAAPTAAALRRQPPVQPQLRQRQQPCSTSATAAARGSSSTTMRSRLLVQCSAAPLQQQQQASGGGNSSSIPQPAASTSGRSSPGVAPEGDVLIEFKNVWKSFGSKHILRGATFKIRRGEAVGIIGSSGTGKSTTLRLAAGLLEPDRGEVLIKGAARQGLISDDDTSDKLKVGLVFQSGALFDSLSVGENVGFLLHEHTNLPVPKIQALVAESLGKVGLSGVEALYPSELSGGMKKRVALARAIVRDEQHDSVEQVIMYDEPTAGLDPVASTVVEDLIRELHEQHGSGRHTHGAPAHRQHGSGGGSSGGGNGAAAAAAVAAPPAAAAAVQEEPGGITSYIVVTHQHSTIRRAVDRIIFLHEGRVVWEGTVDEFDTTDEPIVRQFASGSLKGPIKYE